MQALTYQQHKLLVFICQYIDEKSISPSMEEMKDHLKLASKSTVYKLLLSLQEKKYIRRAPHKARALEVLKYPRNFNNTSYASSQKAVRPCSASSFFSAVTGGVKQCIYLPLYGKIPYETTVESFRNHTTFIEVPTSMLDKGEYYSFQIEGNFMQGFGILDNDILLINKSRDSNNDDLVLALVNETQIMFRKYEKKENMIFLKSGNSPLGTQELAFNKEKVKLQGVLTGLIRRY